MASKDEVIQAKEILSTRLLSMGLRSGVMARRYTTRMREAVADAGSNVHAIGVGRKVVSGEPTDELAVKIYVIQKLAPSAIPPRDLLPAQLEGIPCDVIESPPAFILPRRKPGIRASPAPAKRGAEETPTAAAADCSDARRDRQRPLVAGVSIAHRVVTAGTIGYFCRSTRPGDSPDDIFVLSNNHVLANVNQGSTGDEILQPGPADGGSLVDQVATLHRFERIRLGGDVPNSVDAAIARLSPDLGHQLSICRIGSVTGTERGTEEMRVRKHGRTSGLTEGVITDEPYDTLVGMDHSDPSVVARFTGQMRIERAGSSAAFGLGGDSGSLVVGAGNRRAVGLYFAGPDNGVYGVANHIGDVLDQLQIELII